MSDDWFRSSTWERKDRELFEQKLSRARSSRSQYLRIQGHTLSESPDKRVRAAGGDLLERVFREHPDDVFQHAMAHSDLARWHRREGRDDDAARHFREAVALENAMNRCLDTGADLDLAELLVAMRDSTAFDEALRLLDRAAEHGLAFKSQRWRWLITSARLAVLANEPRRAAEHARAALELFDIEAPDFTRHPTLGHIVADDETVQEVRRMARLTAD